MVRISQHIRRQLIGLKPWERQSPDWRVGKTPFGRMAFPGLVRFVSRTSGCANLLNTAVAPPSWRLSAGWKPALRLKPGHRQSANISLISRIGLGARTVALPRAWRGQSAPSSTSNWEKPSEATARAVCQSAGGTRFRWAQPKGCGVRVKVGKPAPASSHGPLLRLVLYSGAMRPG